MEDLFFAREQHVCQQIGEKKLNKRNKNQKCESELQKITPAGKAGAMKVLRKITTQHRQLILHEIFTKDNTQPIN